MEQSLISAIDVLLDYVASHKETILHAEVPELLALDQDVGTFCQLTGLALPATCGAGYGDNVVGLCRIPVSRHSGGVKIIQDPGWFVALRGLRKMAELRQPLRNNQHYAQAHVVVPSSATEEPALTHRQYAILDVLYDLKSLGPDQRTTTSDIAEKIDGPTADPAGFKEAVADLVERGLVSTKIGRGGGCWLSDDGRSLVERQRKR